MKRNVTIVLLLCTLFVLPQLALAERDFYKVGVITSLSGDLATGGSVTKRGYDLWAQTLNATGGIEINGKNLKSTWSTETISLNRIRPHPQPSGWPPKRRSILFSVHMPRERPWPQLRSSKNTKSL